MGSSNSPSVGPPVAFILSGNIPYGRKSAIAITDVGATQACEGRGRSVHEGSHEALAATRESLEDYLPQLADAVMACRPSRGNPADINLVEQPGQVVAQIESHGQATATNEGTCSEA